VKAITFDAAIPRYALGMALGQVFPSIYWNGLSCTSYHDVPEPSLPGKDWVLVRTRLAGICGTDTGIVFLKASPYMSPLASFPNIIGHENVGRIMKTGPEAGDWKEGERVVVEPMLWCRPRGIDPVCPHCARGEINLCENFTEGAISAGMLTGACRDTGGSWGERFTAHTSQLYRLPESINDENGLMIEPFAVALHAVLQNFPADGHTVLIIGGGTIGQCTLAALRSLGSKARILLLARHTFQAEAALRLGATQAFSGLAGRPLFERIAQETGAKVLQPIIGRQVLYGGVEQVFDCVGGQTSLDDGLRLAGQGGKLVLMAVPGFTPKVDWTAAVEQEIDVQAAYCSHHAEPWRESRWTSFELALHLMKTGLVDLGWMVTHRFRLEEYAQAFQMARHRKSAHAFKLAFDFGD